MRDVVVVVVVVVVIVGGGGSGKWLLLNHFQFRREPCRISLEFHRNQLFFADIRVLLMRKFSRKNYKKSANLSFGGGWGRKGAQFFSENFERGDFLENLPKSKLEGKKS